MSVPDRTREAVLVERLHARTTSRSLAWTPAEHEDRYQVNVGDYEVEIGEGTDGEPEMQICRAADGKALEIVTPPGVERGRRDRAAPAPGLRRDL